MARVSSIETVNPTAEVQALYARLERLLGRPVVLNVLQVLAHAPSLLAGISSLGDVILHGLTLDPQLRELALLQVVRLTRCEYGFQQHVQIGKAVGLTDKQIANVGGYRTYPYYREVERVVLEYAEAVTREVAVSDELFARVRQHFGEQEVVELTMAIGYWNMMSRFIVPLQVELEERS